MSGAETLCERDVMMVLDELHMPHSSLGFQYLVEAILIVCRGGAEDQTRPIMSLYDEVAAACNTTPIRVERAIRTMLCRARCGRTNGQFIYWAADRLIFGDPHEHPAPRSADALEDNDAAGEYSAQN